MKKYFFTLLSLFILAGSAFALELQGGVSFDVNSARDYVMQDKVDSIDVSGPEKFQYDESISNMVYSYNNKKEVIGITVQYDDDPTTAYIYDKNNDLIYIDKYDKPVNIYPHRGYRYDLNGNLILTSLTVSKNELFRFLPEGKLIVHSINNVIYDENGNVIGNSSNKSKK